MALLSGSIHASASGSAQARTAPEQRLLQLSYTAPEEVDSEDIDPEKQSYEEDASSCSEAAPGTKRPRTSLLWTVELAR